jgi:DNA topoisomerase-1
VEAELDAGSGRQTFTAKLVGVNGEPLRVANGTDADGKEVFLANALPDKEATDEAVAELQRAAWRVRSVEKKERRRNAPAPYTTSKLQQDASGRLGFNVRRTMGVAQRLYEGVEIGGEGTVGLITYMRTDSVRVSPDAIVEAREYIATLGKGYLPEKANEFKGKKDAQDAHEAIRPTSVAFTPESIRRYLSDEQFRLYRMIWQRFVASQMTQAVFDQTTVDIEAKATHSYDFRVTGSVLKFDGFLKFEEQDKKAREAAKKQASKEEEAQAARVNGAAAAGAAVADEDEDADKRLPDLNDGEALKLERLLPEQKFTQPPPRYNEASLVKVLEERGIGRPSTYASIINTIQDRDYVKKIQGKFVPTEIGTVVTGLLVKNFPYIFDTQYTAKLETELDAVEDGEEKWTDLLNGFYDHFEQELVVAGKNMEDIKRMEQATNETCDKCGSPLYLKWGKFGSFYSCSNFSKA